MLRWLKTWGPWIVIGVCALFFADEALAQSTGGSFGGGNFGGGGGSSGGGGGSSGGGGDSGDGLISFVIYVLFSRMPWPFKIALIGGAVAIFAVVKVVRRKKKMKGEHDTQGPPGPPNVP